MSWHEVKNKSNSAAGGVQVGANLQEELSVNLHFRKLKCCKTVRKLKVISHVAQSLTVSEILQFQNVDLEKPRQVHWLEFSQWYH